MKPMKQLLLLLLLLQEAAFAQTTINIPPCANCPTSTTALGSLAPCRQAFVNIKTFGIQNMGDNQEGVFGTNASAYNSMFLASDGKTLYDARGAYNSTELIPNIYSPNSLQPTRMQAVIPMNVVRQKFPNMTFKTFSHVLRSNFSEGEYLFLLNDQNDLYGMVLNPDGTSNGNIVYYPPLGPTLGATNIPPRTSNPTAWKNDVYRVVQLTSSPSVKFSSFWHGSLASTSTSANGGSSGSKAFTMFGYNPLDNLVYSWGAFVSYNISGQTGATTNSPSAAGLQYLLRTPSSLTASLTPSPATAINTILQRNNTTLQEMSDSLITFLHGISSTNGGVTWQSTKFIGKDGAVYRYFSSNGNNLRIVLPNGVKAISLTQQFPLWPIGRNFIL